jgi:hypothetical protein
MQDLDSAKYKQGQEQIKKEGQQAIVGWDTYGKARYPSSSLRILRGSWQI